MNTFANKVQLIGNLGQDPTIVQLENGKKVARFSLATSNTYTNKHGERITDTTWHNIVAWNKTAEIIEQYVSKGNRIGVDGSITTRTYTDKDGNKRQQTEITCSSVLMLGTTL